MKRIRVLLIEDSEDDALLVERSLKHGGIDPVLLRVSDGESLTKALDEAEWDVILCDYMMPGFSTEAAFEIVLSRDLDIPFILVSGTIPDEIAVDLMRRGVHDYILKDNLSRLAPAIIREIGEAEARKKKRLTEIALKESEKRHRLLIHSMTDTILVIDVSGSVPEVYSKGDIVPANDGAANLHLRDLFSQDVVERILGVAKRVVQLRRPISFEFVTQVQRYPVWVLASLSLHDDNKHIVVVLRNITNLRRIESQKRAADRIASLYLDLLGHDIRNHLQAILITAELLESIANCEDAKALINTIVEEVRKCNEIISSVQTTDKFLQAPLQEVDINSILVRCMEEIATNNPHVTIESHILVADAKVMADSFLHMLFLNILDNAVKHNPRPNPRIWLSLSELRNGYEVTISDDGPGIPDEQKRVLFDPSARLSGVGLHQAIQIIEKYGGDIEILDRVQGDYTQGATFRIWLPKVDSTL